jgi:ATP-dependent exoDNAse (exonuclease V) beta subunit
VHHYLEQIARLGDTSWRQRETAEKELIIGRQLAVMGVPNSELANGVREVLMAVEKTLASEKGKWLLFAHPQHACELALTGVVDGDLVHAVIDRTFVAGESRWVVDYKTTAPKEKETMAAFISRQKKQYHQQLQTYAELMKLQSDDFPIRKALYFPLIDSWCEL